MKILISRMLEQQDQFKLTDDQVRQLEQIRTKYQEKYKGHVEEMRRSHGARSALRAGMDSTRAEVAGVLTPEQEKQVEAMREEWRRRGRMRTDGITVASTGSTTITRRRRMGEEIMSP